LKSLNSPLKLAEGCSGS